MSFYLVDSMVEDGTKPPGSCCRSSTQSFLALTAKAALSFVARFIQRSLPFLENDGEREGFAGDFTVVVRA